MRKIQDPDIDYPSEKAFAKSKCLLSLKLLNQFLSNLAWSLSNKIFKKKKKKKS